MAGAMNSAKHIQGPVGEPLYDIDPQSGATIEVFYADAALAKCFDIRCAGWLWWSCRQGCLPHTVPTGPFPTRDAAYRDALGGAERLFAK
jgi:hypothetical protein